MELTPGEHLATEGREWFLSVDGASSQARSRAGVILKGLDGVLIEQSLHFEFKASNNQVEYKALLAGMRPGKWRIPSEESPIDQILGESNEDGDHIWKIYTSTRASRLKQKSGLIVEASQYPEKGTTKVGHPQKLKQTDSREVGSMLRWGKRDMDESVLKIPERIGSPMMQLKLKS
ncbi:hypothetical protein CR513_24731, partial [Mucuna pruriens]